MRPCSFLRHLMLPQRQPHRVPTNHTIVPPRKTVDCGVKSDEDDVSEHRKNRICDTRHGILFLDDKFDAFEFRGETHRKRDVPTGSDDDVGFEIVEFAEALD